METTVEGVEAFDQLELVISKGAQVRPGLDLFQGAAGRRESRRGWAAANSRSSPTGRKSIAPNGAACSAASASSTTITATKRSCATCRKTGAFIEGLLGVPVDTGLVLDLGAGQLVVCTVTRSQDAQIAVEFETPLVSDGAGGLCTRHRVSPTPSPRPACRWRRCRRATTRSNNCTGPAEQAAVPAGHERPRRGLSQISAG